MYCTVEWMNLNPICPLCQIDQFDKKIFNNQNKSRSAWGGRGVTVRSPGGKPARHLQTHSRSAFICWTIIVIVVAVVVVVVVDKQTNNHNHSLSCLFAWTIAVFLLVFVVLLSCCRQTDPFKAWFYLLQLLSLFDCRGCSCFVVVDKHPDRVVFLFAWTAIVEKGIQSLFGWSDKIPVVDYSHFYKKFSF